MGLPPNMQLVSGVTAKGIPGKPDDLRKFDGQRKPQDSVGVEACPNGTVRITIPGPPPGKPRMTRCDKWKKRPKVMRYREWCDRVREAVGDSLPAASNVAEVNWIAFYEPPRSWSKVKRYNAIGGPHCVKPDIDNVAKAILDCLFAEDQNISQMSCSKRWGWVARLEVEILTAAAAGGK